MPTPGYLVDTGGGLYTIDSVGPPDAYLIDNGSGGLDLSLSPVGAVPITMWEDGTISAGAIMAGYLVSAPGGGYTINVIGPANAYFVLDAEGNITIDPLATSGLEIQVYSGDGRINIVTGLTAVSRLVEANWNVNQLARRNMRTEFNVLNAVRREVVTRWYVLSTVGREVAVSWNTYTLVQQLMVTRWATNQLARRNMRIEFNVAGTLSSRRWIAPATVWTERQ